ncbi:MAG: type IX secretion system membrane protein PorP/SprF [Bacteroidales bacterium]
MILRIFNSQIARSFWLILFLLCAVQARSQQSPLYPLSNRVFNPFVINPAAAGSKDFASIDMNLSSLAKNTSMLLSFNTRLTKKGNEYFSAPAEYTFSRIAVGGFAFSEEAGVHRNIGSGLSIAYHLPLGSDNLSFLSVGATLKGIYNIYDGEPDLGKAAKNMFIPQADAGIYFYSPVFTAGLSATNLLGEPDDTSATGIPVSRQLFFTAGYKLRLSQVRNFILEPGVIINTDDSFSTDVSDMVQPYMKLYLEKFCMGTYLSSFERLGVFFQYRYPGFYISSYFGIPLESKPFFKSPMLAEFAIGVNLSGHKLKFMGLNHW